MSSIPDLIAVEFPGYSNDPRALLKLIGGPDALLNCIKNNSAVALYMRNDLFSRPIYGHIITTSNLAIKVIKQRNKKTGKIRIKYEIIGMINRTVRFRSLADYQVLPKEDNSIVRLRTDLEEWNMEGIEKFRFSHEKGIVEKLSNIPPPLFSPIETALDYKYSQNPAVVKVRVEEDGQSTIKTMNKHSNTDKLHCAILNMKSIQVPTGPPEEFKPLDVPKGAVEEITNLFQNHRPVWSRTALLNSMTPEYAKYIKQLLPRVAYLIPRGGFKDTWVKYGFDPRKDSSSAKWQMISMRSTLKKTKTFRGFSSRAPVNSSKTDPNNHIFNGSNFTGSINTFQVCDIIDPDILPFLETFGSPRNHFSKRSGWYSSKFVDHLRKMMTNKANALRGEPSSCVINDKFFEDKEKTDTSSSSSSSEEEEEILGEPEDLENSVKSKVNELMRLLRGQNEQNGHDLQDDMEEYSFFQED